MSIQPNHEISAAWVKIEPELKQFDRGSDISDEWVEKTGGVLAYRMEPRIKKYFLAINLEPVRRGKVIHICTDEESDDLGDRRRERGNGENKRSLRAYNSINRSNLTAARCRELDFHLSYLRAKIEEHEKHSKEVKAILGAPAPRPMLKAIEKP